MKLKVDRLHRSFELLTIDFETYYSDTYSLSKPAYNLTTYIRDPQFYVQGASLKWGDAPAVWYTGERLKDVFAAIDWDGVAAIAQNAHFDTLVLAEHYGHYPGYIIDTKSMSRFVFGPGVKHNLDAICQRLNVPTKLKGALESVKNVRVPSVEQEAALGQYCINDSDITFACFLALYNVVPDIEMDLIDLTAQLFIRSNVTLDVALVQKVLDDELSRRDTALIDSKLPLDVLRSNQKFAAWLGAKNVPVPMKTSLTTQKPTYAFAKTDTEFLELLDHPDPDVGAAVAGRLLLKSSIVESRAKRFLAEVSHTQGVRLPVALNYYAAITGRWGGTNKMNLQNLGRGSDLRRAIIARQPDHVIVVADSAQIEARVLAWLAGHTELLQAFAHREDVYKLQASRVFNVPVEQVTKDQRFIGKVLILGLGYAMGANRLMHTLRLGLMGPKVDVDLETARHYVTSYRASNPAIPAYWQLLESMLPFMANGQGTSQQRMHLGPLTFSQHRITGPTGAYLYYQDLALDPYTLEYSYQRGHDRRSRLHGGILTENVVQKLARDIIAQQALRIDAMPEVQLVTLTHDEIVVTTHKDYAEHVLATMLDVMSTPPDWAASLPLAAEGGYDVCYSK